VTGNAVGNSPAFIAYFTI